MNFLLFIPLPKIYRNFNINKNKQIKKINNFIPTMVVFVVLKCNFLLSDFPVSSNDNNNFDI
jgi:hypothetical protein